MRDYEAELLEMLRNAPTAEQLIANATRPEDMPKPHPEAVALDESALSFDERVDLMVARDEKVSDAYRAATTRAAVYIWQFGQLLKLVRQSSETP